MAQPHMLPYTILLANEEDFSLEENTGFILNFWCWESKGKQHQKCCSCFSMTRSIQVTKKQICLQPGVPEWWDVITNPSISGWWICTSSKMDVYS